MGNSNTSYEHLIKDKFDIVDLSHNETIYSNRNNEKFFQFIDQVLVKSEYYSKDIYDKLKNSLDIKLNVNIYTSDYYNYVATQSYIRLLFGFNYYINSNDTSVINDIRNFCNTTLYWYNSSYNKMNIHKCLQTNANIYLQKLENNKSKIYDGINNLEDMLNNLDTYNKLENMIKEKNLTKKDLNDLRMDLKLLLIEKKSLSAQQMYNYIIVLEESNKTMELINSKNYSVTYSCSHGY